MYNYGVHVITQLIRKQDQERKKKKRKIDWMKKM